MSLLLLVHALAGGVGLAGSRRLGRRGFLLGLACLLATAAWFSTEIGSVLDGTVIAEHVEWMPAIGIDLDWRFDGFAALMVVLVVGIGLAVFAYAHAYFERSDAKVGRVAGLLILFSGSMLGLVLADNVIVLYGCWELTSVLSFLMIGYRDEDTRARAAALQALFVTSAGALVMLVGLLVLGQRAGTFRLSEIAADPPSGTAVEIAIVCILVGAFAKSAQFPLHTWLPGAMAAPTPVSAYLHAATMVKAGVYLVARLAPAFAALELWRPVVVTVGLVTMVVGGARALLQHDMKLMLAMGTVSQLGLLVAVFGLGSDAAMIAGSALLVAHGLFKAAAFMVVGTIDQRYGTRDVGRIPAAARREWTIVVPAIVAAASMAGLPPLFGFIAKEEALQSLADSSMSGAVVALVAAVLASAFTVAYSAKFVYGALGLLSGADGNAEVHRRLTPGLVGPAVVLAALTVVAGLAPGLFNPLVEQAAQSLAGDDVHAHLQLWHGVNEALIASVIAIAGGLVVFAGRRTVEPALTVLYGRVEPSSRGYRGVIRSLGIVANRVTRITQPGSLPVYLGVILGVAALVPGIILANEGLTRSGLPIVGNLAVVPFVALIVGGGLAASIIHRRFTAAVFLGVVGYAMAGIYVIAGAPDVALTQVGIESLTTVLFVLVLRRLPDRFDTRVAVWRKSVRIVVSALIGTSVVVLALAAHAGSPDPSASDDYVEQALPEGGGSNVVNVILVDFRGLDTMGEITVLAAAAIGTVALARAGRLPRGLTEDGQPDAPPPVRVARLATLDTTVRLVFAVVAVASLYLLFVGHNQPGGGFAGGIVAGSAIALRYLSGGIDSVRALSRGQPWLVLGAGIAIASFTALAPLLFGGPVLEGVYVDFDAPVLGHVKITSALFFDLGVFLTVIGLALMVFESFGDDPPPANGVTT